MNEYFLYLMTALLATLSMFISNLANAADTGLEIHIHKPVNHGQQGPVDRAYGYLQLLQDPMGRGTINVMFSNASQIDGARFNARVEFLDADGDVIEEVLMDSRVGAPKSDDAIESLIKRPLPRIDFETVEVEFYLSDILHPLTASREGGQALSLN